MKKLLKSLLTLALSLIKVLSIFVILILGIYTYYAFTASDSGEQWCDNIISDYESDKDKYYESHIDLLRDGRITLLPAQENKNVRGQFTADKTGEYECSYSHGGISRPHSYQYTSETRKWIKID